MEICAMGAAAVIGKGPYVAALVSDCSTIGREGDEEKRTTSAVPADDISEALHISRVITSGNTGVDGGWDGGSAGAGAATPQLTAHE